MVQIHQAKTEAIQFNSMGKRQLAGDVRYLYHLLEKAKVDVAQKDETIENLQGEIVQMKVQSSCFLVPCRR